MVQEGVLLTSAVSIGRAGDALRTSETVEHSFAGRNSLSVHIEVRGTHHAGGLIVVLASIGFPTPGTASATHFKQAIS